MPEYRLPFVQTRRDAWIEINLANIEHNINEIKKFVKPDTKLLAVIKADAYGHGATMVAPTLLASGVNMFGVASVDEGLQLRASGVECPILVLGAAPNWSFVDATKNDICLSVFTEDHIEECIKTFEKLGKKPTVHIKVDTGMHRIGISHKKAIDFINKVSKMPEINLAGVFTHLANAENDELTKEQITNWENVIKNINNKNLILHALNTAGLITNFSHNENTYDMVRAGIGIYGLYPDLSSSTNNQPDLKQALSLRGRIAHIKTVQTNSGISYGYSFVTNRDTKVATVPIGYADGVPRALSNKIYGLINGKKVKQIGNITMDQMMFDITDIDNVTTGDIITLLGDDEEGFISVDEWAKLLNTINYEITCILRVRLPKVYTRES